MEPIIIKIPATRENFYEAGYLAANPDVAQGVAAGTIKSGKQHFEEFGTHEGGMQWAVELTPLPGGRRIHPLSAHPPAGIWHRLQHTFVSEPELPKPLLEPNSSTNGDVAVCARLIDAFSRAVAYEQDNIPPENRPNDGIWERVKIAHHGEAYRLLATKDAAGLADYLRNGLRTSLCRGLGNGPYIFQSMSGPDWRDPVLQIVDCLAALAEAIGALPYEHPGHGEYGQNINLPIPELADRIESKLRFPIYRPKVMGNFGIGRDSGVIDFRVPDDAYCAHRIRFIVTTHPCSWWSKDRAAGEGVTEGLESGTAMKPPCGDDG